MTITKKTKGAVQPFYNSAAQKLDRCVELERCCYLISARSRRVVKNGSEKENKDKECNAYIIKLIHILEAEIGIPWDRPE